MNNLKLYITYVMDNCTGLVCVANSKEEAIENFIEVLKEDNIDIDFSKIKWNIDELSEVDGYKIHLEKDK